MEHGKLKIKGRKPLKGALQHRSSLCKLIPLSSEPVILVYHLGELTVSARPGKLRRQLRDPDM
jgi:hypothetical protein